MIGFIKNLFSSILSFFVGLFGGKKSLENKSSTTSADTAKTGNKMLSSFTGLLGDKKSQDKPSTTSAESAAATAKPRKRSGYFMELDETGETNSVNGNQPTKVTETKTSTPVAAAKPAKKESDKTPEAVAAAKPVKEEPAQISEATASAQSAKIDLIQTAKGVKAVPAEREKAPGASANGQNSTETTETTFAPKYLAPNSTSNSRRRPGPSMNPFLDMARQVKTPD